MAITVNKQCSYVVYLVYLLLLVQLHIPMNVHDMKYRFPVVDIVAFISLVLFVKRSIDPG
jgi:hypothetical protein